MAIVKTGDTLALAEQLAEELFGALIGAGQVADDVAYMKQQMDLYAPALSASGTASGGTESWDFLRGSSAVTYNTTFTNTPVVGNGDYYDWLLNGAEKYSLSGTGLEGAGLVNRYNYVLQTTEALNVAGYSGTSTVSDRRSAVIEFDLSASSFSVTQASRVVAEKSYQSGQSDQSAASGDGLKRTASTSTAFNGEANYLLVNGNLNYDSSTVNRYSSLVKESWSDAGNFARSSEMATEARQFQLQSASGFKGSYNANTGELAIGGAIDAFSFSLTASEVSGAEAPQKTQDYFRYTNTASPLDDVDLSVLQNYFANVDYAHALMWQNELMKGDDTILVTDPSGGEITAGAGNDKVTGGQGSDVVYGESGNDLISGGNGEDYLYGGDGADTLKGDAHDDELEGGAGADYLDGGSGNDVLAGGTDNDKLLGGAGADKLNGNDGDDYLDGGVGNDYLLGDAGSDTLKGGAGNDVLRGGAGNDLIDGGAGSDLIIGGAGIDVMTGGTGVDGFFFESGDSGNAALDRASLDQITGFNVAQDRILFDFNFTEADVGNVGAAAGYSLALIAAKAEGSRIVVGYDASNTYVFADTDDNGTLDLAIELVGVKGAAAANLILDTYTTVGW